MKDVRREEEYLCTGGMIDVLQLAMVFLFRNHNILKRTKRHYKKSISDGKKLPILFILRGMPGGTVETDELPTYPSDHVYTVQESGWMDVTVWQTAEHRGGGDVSNCVSRSC
ncbi:hypothetical protein PI124_g16590 [Phytophthora idaei]|nr:hypothetical protein PI124_g16590 [Phytophthora idaei]